VLKRGRRAWLVRRDFSQFICSTPDHWGIRFHSGSELEEGFYEL